MDTQQLLIEAIERFPFDITPANMLRDHFQENGYDPQFADALVEGSVWAARRKAIHRRAAAFVATRCNARRALAHAMHLACGCEAEYPYNLILEEGYIVPYMRRQAAPTADTFWYPTTVHVGAEWVMKWRDLYGEEIMDRWHRRTPHWKRQRRAANGRFTRRPTHRPVPSVS